jgi:monoamine oxidase
MKLHIMILNVFVAFTILNPSLQAQPAITPELISKGEIKKTRDKKIAVIGAGLAGLTAAYRLTQQGLDVDVFEAKNRVGGRVFTILMENYLGKVTEVELGGQNITDGGEAVHLIHLARELKLNVREKIININQLVWSENTKEYYHILVTNHHTSINDLPMLATKVKNIGQLIESFCQDNLMLKQALLTRAMGYEGVDPYQQSIYHNIETLECILAGGFAKAHEFYQHQHNQVVTSVIDGGNAKIPLELAKHLEGRIHYNKALKKIGVNDASALLTFADQSVYTYDYVVLALPAATFNTIDFSDSLIDSTTLQHIKSIRYGMNYKIALPLDLSKTNNISSVIKNNTGSFYNHDDTIQILYINDKTPDIEDAIRTFSESYNNPFPSFSTSVVQAADKNYELYRGNTYYDWKNDIYSQGSYSGYSTSIAEELDHIVHHSGIAYKAIFVPIKNILFFAGEHTTILECIGTMEAAVESGERIAKAITQLIPAH